MNTLSDIFQGNPFGTAIGQKIERATEPIEVAENWALYMEICDDINSTEEGPKDAIRAIRRRLNSSIGKNNSSVLFSLTVLETCVKNCGYRFHLVVATRDVLQDLVRLIGVRPDVPMAVQDKVLALLQSWMDAFRGQPDLKEVSKTYEELRSKGVEFPMTDVDTMVPINTPKSAFDPAKQAKVNPVARRHSKGKYAALLDDNDDDFYDEGIKPRSQHNVKPKESGRAPPPASIYTNPAPPAPIVYQMPAPGTHYPQQHQQPQFQVQQQQQHPRPQSYSGHQMEKLHRELELVQTNSRVFNDLLNEYSLSSDIPADALQLIQELNVSCREMQKRVMQLLGTIESCGEGEDQQSGGPDLSTILVELLHVNDELNNTFVRYDRFSRSREGLATTADDASGDASAAGGDGSVVMPAAGGHDVLPPSYTDVGATRGLDLMDFSAPAGAGGLSHQLAGLSVQSNTASSRLGDTYSAQQEAGQMSAGITSHRDQRDKAEPLIEGIPDTKEELDEMEEWIKTHEGVGGGESNPVSSSEFDQFLAERTGVDLSVNGDTPTRRRQMQKDEKEDAMFAL